MAPEPLDPAFVFNPEDPKTFWDNYQYFQAENQRKQQEWLEDHTAKAVEWLKAEAAWAKKKR